MSHYLGALLVACLLVCNVLAEDERLVVRQDPKDPSRFHCDIKYATFTTPEGWEPNRSGGNTYAALSSSSETSPDLTKLISIDVGKPAKPTAKQMAIAFAKQWKGQVAQDPLKLDGEEAYRVTIPPDNKTLRPAECIIAIQGGRAFLLIGGAKQEGALGKAMDELVDSWKWTK